MQPFTNHYLFWPLKWSNTSLREKLVTIHPVVGAVSREKLVTIHPVVGVVSREKLVTIHPVVGVVSRYLSKFYQ